MQLRYSKTSPFARKVRVMAIETRLDEIIDLVETNPHDPATDLGSINPLGKVPALMTDDGLVLFDSPVICEYLDHRHGGSRMIPVATPGRWHVLRQQALADGVMEAGVGIVMEGRRAEGERSAGFVARQRRLIVRAADWLEDHAVEFDGSVNLGHIAVACALAYLDFRLPETEWRRGRGAIAGWFERMASRESMRRTAP